MPSTMMLAMMLSDLVRANRLREHPLDFSKCVCHNGGMNTTEQPYLGRCKSCDFAVFATAEDVREAEDFSAVKAGQAFRIGQNVCSRCFNGHKAFVLKRIEG